METKKLREAELRFFELYPGGFSNPDMLAIAKKHKLDKMTKSAQESFAPERFADPTAIAESMGKIAGQSSLVSVFEKAKFKDLIKELNSQEKERLAEGLHGFLHGEQAPGFAAMVEVLDEYKLAKWPLLTVYGVYYNPNAELLIKPTTVKGIIDYFGFGIRYASRPNYEFYAAYRDSILALKKLSHPELQVDNAAFCGFLMIALANEA